VVFGHLAAVGIGVWLTSFAIEAMRSRPKPPAKLRWAPNIPIHSVEIGGNRLRYIKSGKDRALVLLHTLRTQLDLFEKVVPELAKHFSVYAWTIQATAIPTFPRRATMRLFLPTRYKAFSTSSTSTTSPSPASRLEGRSFLSSPPGTIRA